MVYNTLAPDQAKSTMEGGKGTTQEENDQEVGGRRMRNIKFFNDLLVHFKQTIKNQN